MEVESGDWRMVKGELRVECGEWILMCVIAPHEWSAR